MFESGSVVRFLQNSRHEDWKKGDLGYIDRQLALPPQNQFSLFVVRLKHSGKSVWATNEDIEEFNQLTLEDI
jgi:hypothetical protein